MTSPLARLDGRAFDALVIGGGITGVACAHAFALLGWDTALIERRDLAWGTSGRSSRLIHGGLRYLAQAEFRVVRASLQERRALAVRAPHLVRPTPFLLPLGRGESWAWRTFAPLGVRLYDLLAGKESWPRARTIARDEAEILVPGLDLGPRDRVMAYYDAVTDDRRLTEITALAASGAGARIATRVEVVTVEPSAAGFASVALRDSITGDESRVRARAIVNATGAWADETRRRLGLATKRALVRQSRGAHLTYPWRIDGAALVPHPRDGRVGFLVPTATGMIVGTTDDADDVAPDRVAASAEDIAYLEELVRSALPHLPVEPCAAWAGLRPLVNVSGATSRVTRDARVTIEEVAGIPLLSLVGGKLTLHRRMAQDAARALGRRLGAPRRPPATSEGHLPGGDIPSVAGHEARLRARGYDALQARWLCARYGSLAESMLDRAPAPHEALGEVGIPLEAELLWAVEQEGVRTLSDLLMRWRVPEIARDADDESAIEARALALLARDAGFKPARIERERERWRRERALIWGGAPAPGGTS